jgi:membrane peptidoglycan carboxypeptidase
MYGIETASAFYFGKHPSLLTLGECAMLAGIIPAPELLSPFRDPSRFFPTLIYICKFLWFKITSFRNVSF